MFSSTMTKKRSAHGGNRTIFLEVAERDILAPIKRDAMVVVKTLLCYVYYMPKLGMKMKINSIQR